LFEPFRQLLKSLTRGVEDRIAHRSIGADIAQLANALYEIKSRTMLKDYGLRVNDIHRLHGRTGKP
jgi:hypothetical protein